MKDLADLLGCDGVVFEEANKIWIIYEAGCPDAGKELDLTTIPVADQRLLGDHGTIRRQDKAISILQATVDTA